jgi:hypothetical protein
VKVTTLGDSRAGQESHKPNACGSGNVGVRPEALGGSLRNKSCLERSGETEIGKNLYPKAPDMRQRETQSLTDGELYYTIRNGVRMTGVPAWGKPEN